MVYHRTHKTMISSQKCRPRNGGARLSLIRFTVPKRPHTAVATLPGQRPVLPFRVGDRQPSSPLQYFACRACQPGRDADPFPRGLGKNLFVNLRVYRDCKLPVMGCRVEQKSPTVIG